MPHRFPPELIEIIIYRRRQSQCTNLHEMNETRAAEDLISRIAAGEFDGRLYKTILELSKVERKQIIALAARRRNRTLPATVEENASKATSHES